MKKLKSNKMIHIARGETRSCPTRDHNKMNMTMPAHTSTTNLAL
jgi:hypothetical protein